MASQITPTKPEGKEIQVKYQGGSDTFYGLGLIGAWIFFFRRATTPQERVRAFFKGLVWPAILVIKMFEFFDTE